MKKLIAGQLAVLAVLGLVSATLAASAAEVPVEVRARAAGILEALKKIKEGRGRPAPLPRSYTFSEAEFNAWIAYRLDEEREPFVKGAEFKLLAKNRIEGRILIDLGKAPASGVLPKRQDLLLAGSFETRDGKIRINLESLFLGTQPLSPAFVDVIISVLSRLQGVEPTSLKDWYDLPPGVLGLETRPAQVVVIY